MTLIVHQASYVMLQATSALKLSFFIDTENFSKISNAKKIILYTIPRNYQWIFLDKQILKFWGVIYLAILRT